MPNGRIGDHPLTDLLAHGKHPFPADIEAMILKLRDVSPRYLDRISFEQFSDWEAGKNLGAGREFLKSLLAIYEVDLAKLTGKMS